MQGGDQTRGKAVEVLWTTPATLPQLPSPMGHKKSQRDWAESRVRSFETCWARPSSLTILSKVVWKIYGKWSVIYPMACVIARGPWHVRMLEFKEVTSDSERFEVWCSLQLFDNTLGSCSVEANEKAFRPFKSLLLLRTQSHSSSLQIQRHLCSAVFSRPVWGKT